VLGAQQRGILRTPRTLCCARRRRRPRLLQVAQAHPYVVKPSAGRVGSWALAGLMGAVLGCCMVNPDGGDYETWLPQVQAIIDRHAPAFASVGCQLSLQRAQYSHWVQVDILSPPGVVAAGHPGERWRVWAEGVRQGRVWESGRGRQGWSCRACHCVRQRRRWRCCRH
jgi:hypothetical protein